MAFSVLLIVKGRREHLERVLEAIALSAVQPTEIIVVHMNEAAVPLASQQPITQYSLTSDHPLPLAAARNMAARQATSEQLVFLDVDCIPAPDCFETLLGDLSGSDLVMAEPRYLTRSVSTLDFTELAVDGRPNPARNKLELGDSNSFELFWSLGFAIRQTDFRAIGGFDEHYVGYGGEDTDFAFRAQRAGLRLRYSQAQIYHQNHPSYDPPLNWLEDIVSNARRFKQVWGGWPMEGWLQQFADSGYIKWTEDSLSIMRLPTPTEIASAQKPDAL